MAPPPPLSVATNAINRLLKEESSYRAELADQQRRVAGLRARGDGDEGDGGNGAFRLGQEVGWAGVFFVVVWLVGCFGVRADLSAGAGRNARSRRRRRCLGR